MSNCLGARPIRVTVDYEKAQMNAFESMGAEIHGCYFHFTQSLFRKIQELGMAARYVQDNAYLQLCKAFSALAFVPIEDVREAYEKLADRFNTLYDDENSEVVVIKEIDFCK
jgi:hypothetical protein